ncbi:hypothetical protein HBE96_06670 [Clostridium sp. P21]|uniref:Uncharacterized protein n=1 Tax=Clostridium muellerianum TaxID=2716538 RepID=A0A7Y0EF88_9CLOT|nr:hypothetical protein [Clostridium muellerianum]NMM62375.1 hypothetical protein [Clostridium muellerianum]
MEEIITTKYLIQDKSNILYTLNKTNIIQSSSQILDENNFKNNGFNDVAIITKNLLINKFGDLKDVKLLAYTDNSEKKDCRMIYNCNEYKPIDLLESEFEIMMLKDKI